MASEILTGAEPQSWAGGPDGVLVVHGFTGTPQSMRPLAEAFAAAGFTVELPLLPGHGTSVDDMLPTSWTDWSAAADAAYAALAARCRSVVVAGLSMGGTLTLWLATRHPEIRGIVCVNPAAAPNPDVRGLVQMLIDGGDATMPGIASDVAAPGVTELAYDTVPLRPLASLLDAVVALGEEYAACAVPMLLCTSPQDHVVTPSDSDHLAEAWGGAVERLTLPNSYHVATLDLDRGELEAAAVAFARRVTA